TSPPETTHLIAARAKKLLGCPWVADFRDLWTQNLAAQKHCSDALRTHLEKKTLQVADALVTTSAPWAARLSERYWTKPVYTITNGFDPDDFQLRPPRLTDFFSITYAGQLYEGKRDPSVVFEVIAELIREQAISATDV